MGASCSGSRVQLVSSDGWFTPPTVRRLDQSRPKADVRGCRRSLDREGQRDRRAAPGGSRVHRRRPSVRSQDSIRWMRPIPGCFDGFGRDEAHPRACAEASQGLRRRLRRHTRHQRRRDLRRRAAVLPRLRRRDNRIDLESVVEPAEGAAEVCREAGCALIGGETELPGIYREDELDFVPASGS